MSTCCSSLIDEELLVYHILARLPVKSLMRFKCVCKRLKSIIESDSKFIDINLAHLKKHPSLCMVLVEELPMIYNEDDFDTYMDGGWIPLDLRQMYLLTADLCEGVGGGRLPETATIGTIDKLCRYSVPKLNLKPINGLICLFNTASDKAIDFSFYIYNIGTRKSTPWIKSSMAAAKFDTRSGFYRKNPITYTFQFSVNPTTKECKVICVWVIPREKARKKNHHAVVIPREKTRKKTHHAGFIPREETRQKTHNANVVCEILTVGEGTWRRIDEVPINVPTGDSVYVNGFIYWSKWWFKKQGRCTDQPEAVLVEFDVENEKFGTIPIPSFIVDQIGRYNKCYGHNYIYYEYFQRIALLEVKGRLALLSRIEKHTVKLWMLEDDYTNKQKRTTNWTEVIIALPSDWSGNCYDVRFHTVAGTTDGMILQVQLHNGMFLYFYSLEKKTLVEFQISGITSLFSGLHFYSMFTTFTESLLPVREEAPGTSTPMQGQSNLQIGE